MKMAPNQTMYQQQQQQPWPYYYNHPYHPPAPCCNHAPYYLPPPPNFYPQGFYSPSPFGPFPFPPQPYYYHPSPHLPPNYDNNHTSQHCCHPEDDRRSNIKEESQVGDEKLTTNDSILSKDRPHVDPVSPVEMGQHEHDNPFPFQIFWLPPKNDEAGKETKKSNNLDLVAANKNVPSGHTTKQAVQKVIPVKQLTTNEEKKTTETMANAEKKTDHDGSRASPKASKLPPVCLRIDPLPRNKKNTSHSPKSSQQQAQVPLNKSKEHEKSEGNINKVELKQDNLGDNNLPKAKEVVEEVAASEKPQVEENKNKKKNLSEHEAALIIQSLYRGFQIRKSQPLKKLKQVYEVRNQVSELRSRIQNLESSSTSNIQVDGKEKVVIGETIMSLLLKLDTIQGLHPYVREVRKSVAKELVGLQEKLDSLTVIESETPSEEIVFSPQQVIHPENDDAIEEKSDETEAQSGISDNCEHNAKLRENENENGDDAIQEKSDEVKAQSGLCDNQEHKAKISENENDDHAQVYHTFNLEKSTDDVVEDEFKHPPSDSNGVICENREMEATKSQEADCNTIVEPQMELHKEEMDDATAECEVEATKLQEGCNASGEPEMEPNEGKFDECDHSRNEGHEVEGEEVVSADMKLEHEVHVDDSSIRKAEVDNSNVETNKIVYGSDRDLGDDRKDDVGMVEEMKSGAKENEVPKGNEIERYEEVIRELGRRVKELEKKLSKKKKIKVNKCNKRRTGGHMLYNKITV